MSYSFSGPDSGLVPDGEQDGAMLATGPEWRKKKQGVGKPIATEITKDSMLIV
jgi:hypothetical protein